MQHFLVPLQAPCGDLANVKRANIWCKNILKACVQQMITTANECIIDIKYSCLNFRHSRILLFSRQSIAQLIGIFYNYFIKMNNRVKS